MKICRKCGAKYPDNEEICSVDGQKLHPLPHFLANKPVASPSLPSRKEADPFVGKHIEKYKVIRKIGEGGMGVVYEAEHIHIAKKVALKILREDYTKKQDVVERFKQEARSASIIGHPNIIDVTDFGYTHDGRVFFVMEYLDGEDMATILENERVLTFKRSIKIAKQVCDALSAAHEKGIIHRDMKPENIFLCNPNGKKEKVKILDFGIAKMSILDQEGRRLTKTGVVFGTPEYMSPEQAAGKPVDKRIDIYAMGIILYEMLTGKVPFTGDTFMSILSKHIFEKVPSLEEISPEASIPESLQKIIYKCLEKEPVNRFSNADELSTALEAVEKDEEITITITEPKMPRHDGETPGPVLEVIGEGEVPGRKKRGPMVALIAMLIIIPVLVISGLIVYKLSKGEKTETEPSNIGAVVSGKNKENTTSNKKANEEKKTNNAEKMGNDDTTHDLLTKPPAKMVHVKVNTTPEGAIVEVEGAGQVCPTTPCDFESTQGEEINLIIKRGKLKLSKLVVPDEDPTEVQFKIGKPSKKVSEKVTAEKTAGSEKEKEKPTKTKKIKNIDSGDLKTPDIFKDK